MISQYIDTKYPICLAILVVVILSMTLMVNPTLAQATNNSTTDNASQNQTQQQGLDEVNHEFLFSEIQMNILEKNRNVFRVRLYNPTNESSTLSIDGYDGANSQYSITFEPGEIQTYNLTPFSPYGMYYSATISEYQPLSAVQGEDINTSDSTYPIRYYLIQPNPNPPVPAKAFIVFLGGLSVLLLMGSGYFFNARPSRIAKPLNRDDISITSYVDGPDYSYTADDPAMVKLVKFAIDWIKAWGLIILNISMGMWGMYRFLGGSVSGTYNLDFYFFAFEMVVPQLLEDSMVYMLYGELMFWLVFFLGMYIARQRWIELSDTSPRKGDNFLYEMTPPRFRNMTVLADVKKPMPDKTRADRTITYEVPRDWLFEVNKETKGDSYECYDYDIHENVCKVSWSGELKKLNPSKLRESKNTIDYVMETSMWAIDRYHQFLDFYSHDVLMEARYLMARQTAIRQDADLDGLGDTADRVEQRMESRGEADALSGDELAVAQDIQDAESEFDLVEKKQQKRSDGDIIDYEPESAGDGDEDA